MFNGSQIESPPDVAASRSAAPIREAAAPHRQNQSIEESRDAGHAEPFVCISSVLRRLLLQSRVVASRTHVALLEGEAGTGKHLFAQTMHRQSHLADLPFCRSDARAWLSTDCETSSLQGTLYLDRVDLLAATGQGLLLSFLKMLQSDSSANFRLIASSHASLRQLASHSQFLPDLAFRLSAVQFTLPPLREHREDIPPITHALIDRICRRYQQPNALLAPGSLPRLLQHAWPGNVRELASVLESAILSSSSGSLRPTDLNLTQRAVSLPLQHAPASAAVSENAARDLSLDAAIHRHILLVLEKYRGNKLRAARQLGISRSTLYRLLAGGTAPV